MSARSPESRARNIVSNIEKNALEAAKGFAVQFGTDRDFQKTHHAFAWSERMTVKSYVRVHAPKANGLFL
jgi:hypothetical protein